MTPNELRDFKNSEAARIKALRNKKKELISKQKEKQHKETATAMLKMTASSGKNPSKTRQSFSKAINRVRAELPASPQKQAVAVKGLASEYGCQVKKLRNNSENPNKDKINSSIIDQILFTQCQGKEVKWQSGRGKAKTLKVLSDNVS